MYSAILLTLIVARPADDFDRQIEKLLKDSHIVGCSVAFAEDGKVRFAKGYGLADLEQGTPMKPGSVHELASVSKQFTAVSILQLVEQGKLSLDDHLSDFFEGAHADWKKVTVRHLLQHTSGLPDYLGALDKFELEFTVQEIMNTVKDKPLRFEPGTKFEYSNSGYMLLGQIVAQRSGLTFGDATRALFRQAGMKTAVFNDSRAVVPNRAEGYSFDKNQMLREHFTSSSLSGTGDGHVMASALDLVAYDVAMRSGKLLTLASQALMNKPSEVSHEAMKQAPTTIRNAGYGFGVMVGKDSNKLIQNHTGGWMGTNTLFTRYVDEKKCLVVLCNGEGAPLEQIVKLCEKRFLGRLVTARE